MLSKHLDLEIWKSGKRSKPGDRRHLGVLTFWMAYNALGIGLRSRRRYRSKDWVLGTTGVFIFLFFLIFIFEREGDTESEAGSGLWAVSTEPDVGLKLTVREFMTWAWSWTLNRLSHPGAPWALLFLKVYRRRGRGRKQRRPRSD